MTRREFMAASAAMAATGQSGWAQQENSWYQRPMRWAQVAFTEDDPGNYDPNFWLDYFERIHADAACLSAGGVVAFYPTKVPLHYRSRFLGNGDAFGELFEGCRRMGMNVIARTDPHACREDVFQQHPDWVARDAEGNPRRHWAAPDLYVTCALGPYNFEFMTEVTREIVSTYKVDGIFANRWAGHGMCFCDHCRRNFRAFSGRDLPATNNPADEARRQYIVWHEQRLFECWKVWDDAIRKINPQASFIANSGGGALSELDMKTVGGLAETLFADRQARRGLMPPWSNGKNGKEYRSTMGNKAIGGIFSVGVEEPYRWKDSVQSEAEIRVWVADGIAHDLRPWFTKFNAKPIDKRWMPVVESIYQWHWKSERYLRNTRSLARAAMVYSQQTARFYGGEQARAWVEEPSLGFYQAMVEARIPFDMLHDGTLEPSNVDRYQVLVLPNIAALSDAQCRQLEAYVERGGSLVATFETSLYDEWGKQRSDFGLASLFGCSFADKVERRMQNSYLNLEANADGSWHPLLKGLESVPRIINSAGRVHTKTVRTVRSPLTLVPSYPDLPMEDVWARTPRTDTPMAFCRTHGKGRVVYLPMDLDRTFWEVLSNDHALVLQNAVAWAAGSAPPLMVTGDGLLDVSLWRQEASVTAHLVNLTNPMAMKGPYRHIFPAGPFTVSMAVPENTRISGVRLLVADHQASFRLEDGRLLVPVPSIGVHEIVAVDLA
ncbi:MAG: beta-galactosidase trimerization domain-containing protein [Bryobacterales bacterium]|nr:beta-galactosidase trimerization domain-containing protein [Bryobacterales bacterium]